jgi:hypothetical protein
MGLMEDIVKEQIVIDLYDQGKTIRDIAKELRMSWDSRWPYAEKINVKSNRDI